MVSAETKNVIDRAKRIYGEKLQVALESEHQNRFVAIEPESGEYFLGDTFDDAVKSARAKYLPPLAYHPHRTSYRLVSGGHAEVKGWVDEHLRALLRVPVSVSRNG